MAGSTSHDGTLLRHRGGPSSPLGSLRSPAYFPSPRRTEAASSMLGPAPALSRRFPSFFARTPSTCRSFSFGAPPRAPLASDPVPCGWRFVGSSAGASPPSSIASGSSSGLGCVPPSSCAPSPSTCRSFSSAIFFLLPLATALFCAGCASLSFFAGPPSSTASASISAF